MRVAEIAELTGTTVRTVRYYHSLGLLPVPGERGGWRDYDLGHVARLSRIRWLVQAGVSLGTIRRVLDESEATGVEQIDDAPAAGAAGTRSAAGSVVEDLAGALAAVEDHLAEVTRQRDMLAGLLERARTGSTVSPMSPRMAAFFDRLEQAAPDEATRCAVRKERDLTDLACYRGQMPPEAEFLFVDPDPRYDAESLALYSQDPAELSDAQIEQRARAMVSRLEARLPPERLAALAGSVDTETVRALFRLIAATGYPDARLIRTLEREFLTAIDRWRLSE
ncbi:MerR family transcriptional regulator [Actinomyces naeslundii]|uniref:MerR family transcriptional regulator n=1 Tax=Actinomyces naeslundii TaxID=1655 RepID=A0ABX3EY17_ACTNA|nr:MerR family transcriptional regulator [Actinomyces naeslundii]OLO82501.1 MerR family transcriptional regulator [Actinomyces naeslundii]OLO91118.1 MerR family transcriptional regulator [Actinomyces naeslundii]